MGEIPKHICENDNFLKKSGVDLQTIVDCTGLSMEEVEKL